MITRLTSGQSANNPCSTDGGVNDRNDIAELGLKSRVKICAALQRAEAVAVCEFGEDSDIAAVFKLDACGW